MVLSKKVRVIPLRAAVLPSQTTKVSFGFVPRLLTIYFLLQYVFTIVWWQYGTTVELLNIPILAIGFLYVAKKWNAAENRGITTFITIYACFLCAVLSFTTLFAERPGFSIPRVMITCWILWAMSIVFCYVYQKTEEKEDWNNAISKSFVLILIVAIIGQFLIPGWASGYAGIRLGGGINPNGLSFIAYFSSFWYVYRAIKEGQWNRLNKIGWALSLVAVCWGMSRSVLISFGALYAAYAVCLFLTGMWKITFKKILFFSLLGGLAYTMYRYIQESSWYPYLVLRFTSSDGYETRLSAWNVLWEYFNKNVWVGSAGWWNVSHILDVESAGAVSPHNLYLRLLAETGVIGFCAVLALPFIVYFLLMFTVFTRKMDQVNKKKRLFIACMLVGLFVGVMFEDRYLTGYGGIGTAAIVWVISMGIMNLNRKA